MSDLRDYVDELFHGCGNSKKTRELKEEVMGNLEARKLDLMELGHSEIEAEFIARSYITSVDELMGNEVEVNQNSYQLEIVQIVLLGALVSWIVSIPGFFFRSLFVINTLSFFAVLAFGVYYIYLLVSYKKKQPASKKVSLIWWSKATRMAWIVSGIYVLIGVFTTTGIYFGSNIWFRRPISIEGPYQFAHILSSYLAFLYVLVIPIIFRCCKNIWKKHEV